MDNGRDQVWSTDNGATWAAVDAGVTTEMGNVRVAQKIIPTTTMAGVTSVPADVFDAKDMSFEEGRMKPVLEVSLEFLMRQSQVTNESTLCTGQKLARLAAKTVAQTEDLVLFQGKNATLPPHVKVVNKSSAESGLVASAPTAIGISTAGKGYPESIFLHVAEGISKLAALGQPGPYGLFLESSRFADTYRPQPASLVTPADRIIPLVTGGFYSTGALSFGGATYGLLLSLGGEPTSIYLVQDACTAFTQFDPDGVLRFRVYERIQYVARDPRALLRLEFT